MRDAETIRVLVVEDQVLIRMGLAAVLHAAPGYVVVGEAADGDEAVRLARAGRPDVVLMDIRMPGTTGIEATRPILAEAKNWDHAPRILVLTTFDLDEYVYDALQAGAHGFLLKDTPPRRLLAAVATVAGGDMLFTPTVIRRLIEANTKRSVPRLPESPVDLDGLTARELEVLRQVGTGAANTEIAAALVITEATVKTHLNRAMTKLNLTSRAQAVVLAYETGLVVPGSDLPRGQRLRNNTIDVQEPQHRP